MKSFLGCGVTLAHDGSDLDRVHCFKNEDLRNSFVQLKERYRDGDQVEMTEEEDVEQDAEGELVEGIEGLEFGTDGEASGDDD